MLKRLAVILSVLFFAGGILLVSIFRTASVKYSFSDVKADPSDLNIIQKGQELETMEIDYYLAYPGPILPDHPLWSLKALRDKLWLLVTTNSSRKSELNLLFADKRLVTAKMLFEKDKDELGYTTLTKAEKYLEKACDIEKEARERGVDTLDLAGTLIKASLKHRQVIEQILLIAPEDAKPKIIEVEKYAESVYRDKAPVLRERGVLLPENPFAGE